MQNKNRKIYHKPTIQSEKIIETAALACGKCLTGGPISQAACKTKKRIS